MSLVVARTLFGEAWRENFLELNASDERGIDVVRVKVKDFARTRAMGDAPFKIIYLDECDALTKEAQQALRRTMENYTQTCRFILSANFSSKIIDPIQSRCAIFRFKPLPEEDLKEMAKRIATAENIEIGPDALDALVEVASGDCRRLANLLQSASALGDAVTEETVFTLASHAKPEDIQKVLELALAGKFHESRSLLLDIMLRYGMSGLDVIKQLQPAVWKLSIPDRTKVQLIDRCGEIEFRMVEGADEYVQLEALLAHFTTAKQ
jgi:replication factor C small subunit